VTLSAVVPRPVKAGRGTGATACPICFAATPIERHTLREMFFGTRERFEYRRCSACGVLWLEEPPADLSPYYPMTYHTARAPEHGWSRASVGRWLDRRRSARTLFGTGRAAATVARLLGRRVPPDAVAVRRLVRAAALRSFDDPILDVGCGPVPDRLLQLSRVGFRNVAGLDPMIEDDTLVGGVPVHRTTIDAFDGAYALITFHHSFEHVRDPATTLLAAARLLRPGGTIVIRTPVMDGWFWEQYGTSWWELDPPRHLFVHTRRSIDIMAAAAGLAVERVQCDSTYLEVLASDQIAQGIPWRDPASCWNDLANPELRPRIEAAHARVTRLNVEGRGGRAMFFLRAAAGPGAPH
jgi:2-polyprenyl-3-methyl-5-hydroxy-6-metoxy-1,4-benzoquinol methylase